MPRFLPCAAFSLVAAFCPRPSRAADVAPVPVTIPYSLDTPEHHRYLDAAAAGGTATLRVRASITDENGKTIWACGDHQSNVVIAPDTAYFAAYETEWGKYSGNINMSDADGPEGSGPFLIPEFYLTTEPFRSGCGPTGVATMDGVPALKYLVFVDPPQDVITPKGSRLIAHVALHDNETTEVALTNKNIVKPGDTVRPTP